jgi:glycerol-3-phosphate acyltransferase PlsY
LLGVGAAACVGCCAPPLLAFLGTVTLAGVAGTVVFGVAIGLLVVVTGSALTIGAVVRRRRRADAAAAPAPVQLLIPTRRTSETASP